jgi:membrane associated rhomboid family serine protease
MRNPKFFFAIYCSCDWWDGGRFLTPKHFLLRRLQKLGALVWDKVVPERQGWRLLTCIWLHAGVVHLLANMLSLVLIGLRLEQQFGYGTHCYMSS